MPFRSPCQRAEDHGEAGGDGLTRAVAITDPLIADVAPAFGQALASVLGHLLGGRATRHPVGPRRGAVDDNLGHRVRALRWWIIAPLKGVAGGAKDLRGLATGKRSATARVLAPNGPSSAPGEHAPAPTPFHQRQGGRCGLHRCSVEREALPASLRRLQGKHFAIS